MPLAQHPPDKVRVLLDVIADDEKRRLHVVLCQRVQDRLRAAVFIARVKGQVDGVFLGLDDLRLFRLDHFHRSGLRDLVALFVGNGVFDLIGAQLVGGDTAADLDILRQVIAQAVAGAVSRVGIEQVGRNADVLPAGQKDLRLCHCIFDLPLRVGFVSGSVADNINDAVPLLGADHLVGEISVMAVNGRIALLLVAGEPVCLVALGVLELNDRRCGIHNAHNTLHAGALITHCRRVYQNIVPQRLRVHLAGDFHLGRPSEGSEGVAHGFRFHARVHKFRAVLHSHHLAAQQADLRMSVVPGQRYGKAHRHACRDKQHKDNPASFSSHFAPQPNSSEHDNIIQQDGGYSTEKKRYFS